MNPLRSELDHLVLGAATLEQGAAWCEATLGVVPGAGGRHPLMGTHNRLIGIAAAGFPRAYLEIIAIDPEAAPPGRARWFGLDDPTLQTALREAPLLLHFAARTERLDDALAALAALGEDPGLPLAASRSTSAGALRWRITLRDDGSTGHGGALPSLIEWGTVHPADSMPPSGVQLLSLRTDVPVAGPLAAAYRALGLASVAVRADPALPAPCLCATLATPRGRVELRGPLRAPRFLECPAR
jgi:hypothetical protein